MKSNSAKKGKSVAQRIHIKLINVQRTVLQILRRRLEQRKYLRSVVTTIYSVRLSNFYNIDRWSRCIET